MRTYPVLLQMETTLVLSSILNMALVQVFPQGSCYESAKTIQYPHPRLKIANQSLQIPPQAHVCSQDHPPPRWPLISAYSVYWK